MLKYVNYDIVFQEVPGEVTLAVNLSGCPNGCPGCHSPYLQQDVGQELTPAVLEGWLHRYAGEVTCVCFMGGDAAPQEVAALATGLRREGMPEIKTAWYSGRPSLPDRIDPGVFDFIKLGPYEERCGGLRSRTTNQRLYRVERAETERNTASSADGGSSEGTSFGAFRLRDITARFWRDR